MTFISCPRPPDELRPFTQPYRDIQVDNPGSPRQARTFGMEISKPDINGKYEPISQLIKQFIDRNRSTSTKLTDRKDRFDYVDFYHRNTNTHPHNVYNTGVQLGWYITAFLLPKDSSVISSKLLEKALGEFHDLLKKTAEPEISYQHNNKSMGSTRIKRTTTESATDSYLLSLDCVLKAELLVNKFSSSDLKNPRSRKEIFDLIEKSWKKDKEQALENWWENHSFPSLYFFVGLNKDNEAEKDKAFLTTGIRIMEFITEMDELNDSNHKIRLNSNPQRLKAFIKAYTEDRGIQASETQAA